MTHTGHGSITGMKTAAVGLLENSISINAGFKARLDAAVSVSFSNGRTEVLKLSPEGGKGLAAQSIHESSPCFSAFSAPSILLHPPPCCLSCVSLQLHLLIKVKLECCEAEMRNNPPTLSFTETQSVSLENEKVKTANDDRVNS